MRIQRFLLERSLWTWKGEVLSSRCLLSSTGLRIVLLCSLLLTAAGTAVATEPAGTGPPAQDVTSLHVAFLGTRSVPLAGFELSLLGSVTTASTRGLQISGLFNFNKRSATGVQISGFLNHTRRTFVGVQVGPVNSNGRLRGIGLGFVNEARHLWGLQAGVINSAYKARGVQTGFLNHTLTLTGLQVGPVNMTYRFHGVQVGVVNLQANLDASPRDPPPTHNGAGLQVGLFNYAVDANVGQVGFYNWAQARRSAWPADEAGRARTAHTSWLQAGLVNLSDTDSCVQIGLVNVTNRARCATIGLFNFIREGMVSATLWQEPMGGRNFGFRFAGKHFYQLVGAGNANPVYGCEGQNSFHVHVGAMMDLRERWTLEADLGWSFFNAFADHDTRRTPPRKSIPDLDRLSLRVMMRFRLFEFLSIYAGVGPGWIWDGRGISSGGLVPVILGGVSADLPGHVW